MLKIVLFLTAICTMLVFLTHTTALTWNDHSRLATVESLVERHTFQIDDSTFATGDKVFINGHFYSDKPPLLTILLAGAYSMIRAVGVTFAHHRAVVIYLLTLLASTLPFLMCFLFLGKQLIGEGTLSSERALFLVGALAIGTAMFPYATTLNNHIVGGVLAGGISWRLWWGPVPNNRALCFFGALSGFAITFELGTLFIFLSFVLHLLLFFRFQQLEPPISFVAGAMLPVVIHWLINRTITGDIWPGSMHPEFFNYPGSPFNQQNLTSASLAVSSIDDWFEYLTALLIGRRGFLSLSPLIIIGLIYVVNILVSWHSSPLQRWLHAMATLGAFISVIGYYSLFGKEFGARPIPSVGLLF
jgi:hypothetical protein